MKTEISPNPKTSPKSDTAPKVLLGVGIAAAAIIVGLLIYFLRASDPASRAPIAYKKFDYGAHMQQTQPRAATPPSSSSPGAGTP